MNPGIATIMLFAPSWTPAGWFACDGRVLPIQRYPALFDAIGMTFGGDGHVTFALPSLASPLQWGNGEYMIAATTDATEPPVGTVTLTAAQEVPAGSLVCDGSTFPLEIYPELFAVIGMTYGGDGKTFGIPNMPASLAGTRYIIAATG